MQNFKSYLITLLSIVKNVNLRPMAVFSLFCLFMLLAIIGLNFVFKILIYFDLIYFVTGFFIGVNHEVFFNFANEVIPIEK